MSYVTQLICRTMRAVPELFASAQPLSIPTSSMHTLPRAKAGDSAAANSRQQDAFSSKRRELPLLQNLVKTKYSQAPAASVVAKQTFPMQPHGTEAGLSKQAGRRDPGCCHGSQNPTCCSEGSSAPGWSCTPPGSVLQLLPGKAVPSSPHLPARGEEGISTAPRQPELQGVIPEQEQLQLPLQDSSPEPSTQTGSVQGRSTALFC